MSKDENSINHVTPTMGNIYADLGLPEADTMLNKANLAIGIQQAITNRRLARHEAADISGMSEPMLSNLLLGKFREIPESEMMSCLNKLR